MRQFLSLLIVLFIGLMANAEAYQVTANVLNLRTSPSKNAPVGSTAVKGENLNVVAVDGDWATVEKDGATLYGAVQFMQPADSEGEGHNPTVAADRYAEDMLGISVPDSWRHNSDLPLYISIGLLTCLLLIRVFGGSDVYIEHPKLFAAACLAFICTCGLEILY